MTSGWVLVIDIVAFVVTMSISIALQTSGLVTLALMLGLCVLAVCLHVRMIRY